jgi:hypothetical protein
LEDLFEDDYILMFEFHEEHDLAVGALGIGGVDESIKIFF